MQVLQASLEYNAYSHNFQSALPTFYMPNILISFCRQNSILLSILCCFVEWPVKYSPFFKLLPLLSVGEVLDGIQTAEGFLLQTCYSPNYQNLYYQYPIIWNDIVTKRISFFTNSSQSSSGGEVEGFLQKTCFPSFHPNDLTHKPSLVCVSNYSEFQQPTSFLTDMVKQI